MSENINTALAMALIRHLTFLERLENNEIKAINKVLKQKSAEIAQLMRANADIATGSTELSTLTLDQQRRLFDLHRQIDAALIAGQVAVTERLSTALYDFARQEREILIELLNANIPPQTGLTLQLKVLPLEDIAAIVNTPLGGILFQDRLAQDTFLASNRIKASLVNSLLSGKNITQAARDVQRILGDALITRAETLVRTEYARVQTQVNLAAMRDNAEFLKGFIFVGTLDFKICPICKRLHGRFFKVNHNFIIPVHPRSYSDDTEVYTDKGWKLVKDVTTDDKCLSLNPENFDLEYKQVKRTYAHHEAQMAHFTSRNFDLMVTLDHDVFCKRNEKAWTNKRNWEFIEAQKVPTEASFYRSSEWQGKEDKIVEVDGMEFSTSWFVRFMGWYLSEGSLNGNRVNISQSRKANPKNYQEIYDLISERYAYVGQHKDKLSFNDKKLVEYLQKFGRSYEKYIPIEIRDLSAKYLRQFLDAYLAGDGYERKAKKWKGGDFRNGRVYDTSSKAMADHLGELILKCGNRPSFSLQRKKGKEHVFRNGIYILNHDVWRITECYGQTSRMKSCKNDKSGIERNIINYDRMSYCVEISEWHTLLVRRNGRVVWSGNCRCTWIPQVKNWRDLGLTDADVPKDIRDLFDGKPPDMPLDYDEFLRTQSDAFQKDALGLARWKLWKQGYSVKQMATDTRALTLDEIRAKTKQYARQ